MIAGIVAAIGLFVGGLIVVGVVFLLSRSGGKTDDGVVAAKSGVVLDSVTTFTVKDVSFKIILVSGGTFTMGATGEQENSPLDDEKPVHQVTLSEFGIADTEVTQELWQAVMGSNPSQVQGPKLPVENVTWDDCQTFIKKLNELTGETFRLPTEAEWEYAARGGANGDYFKYAGNNQLKKVAWYEVNSGNTSHEVATLAPNELGLYDMSGNVWEWCQDKYGSYSSESQTDPTGARSGSYRVYRGGDWESPSLNCRVSYRNSLTPANRHIGLRLAI